MTKLKFINKFILQWFFIRLTKCTEKVINDYTYTSCGMMPDGSISSNGYGNYTEYYWYSIQGFVIPTTGYDNDFKYLGGKWFFKRITKKYIKE